ncbi:MAG: hypothetical protein O7G87_10565 [bacterium]|nr:hypothetical protein [bacterium]
MADKVQEEELKEKAIEYLKRVWREDTVRMDVKNNSVVDGSGELHVDCTVRVGERHSDWTKWFTFQDGDVSHMRWQMR